MEFQGKFRISESLRSNNIYVYIIIVTTNGLRLFDINPLNGGFQTF